MQYSKYLDALQIDEIWYNLKTQDIKHKTMNFITKHPKAIVAVLLFIMFLMAFLSSAGTENVGGKDPGDSGIVDEIAHIPAGYSYLKYSDYRLNPEHPPLVKDLAALPLVFKSDIKFPLEISAWKDEVNGQWETGWKFIYESGNNPEQIFFLTRLLPMLLIFLLGIYIYKWAKELWGVKAGLFAVLLYAFSPNIITHSHYVTTDFGVTVFLFICLYYFTKFVKKPGWRTLTCATISFALASLSKFSAIILIPYLALLLLVAIIIRRQDIKAFFCIRLMKNGFWKRFLTYLLCGLFILIVAHVIILVPYYFHTKEMPIDLEHRLINESLPQTDGFIPMSRNILNKLADIPVFGSLAIYFLGGVMVFARVGGGNTAYLMGDYQNLGWWYYYIAAFFLKTPLAELIMMFGAFVLGAFVYIKAWQRSKEEIILPERESRHPQFRMRFERLCKFFWMRFDVFVMATVILLFIVAGMKSKANIGVRWMLPIYPFLYVLIGGAFVYWFKNKKRMLLKTIVVSGLVVWLIVSSVSSFPLYLSYFNELIGARSNGYKYLSDSNVDWGQDLKRLGKWVDENKVDPIYVDYFGGGVPEHSISGSEVIRWHSKYGLPPAGSTLAISATFYQMSEYYARANNEVSYVRMLSRDPDYIIGNSILIYRITEDDLKQFKTREEAVLVAADYLKIKQDDFEVSGVSETINQNARNDLKEYPPNFQRPVYSIHFKQDHEDKYVVYIDRLTGEVWGGYAI